MAAIDIATHGRIAISQKGNVAERKNFSKMRIEELPGSHKVAHTPQHLAGRVVKGEAEISNDSLQARFSAKPPGLEKKLLIGGIFFRRRPVLPEVRDQVSTPGEAHISDKPVASIQHNRLARALPARSKRTLVQRRCSGPPDHGNGVAAGYRRAGARRTMPRPDGTRPRKPLMIFPPASCRTHSQRARSAGAILQTGSALHLHIQPRHEPQIFPLVCARQCECGN